MSVPNTLYIRLDDLDPAARKALLDAIDEVALELKREGKKTRVSGTAATLQLLKEALVARGYAMDGGTVHRDEDEPPKKAAGQSHRH